MANGYFNHVTNVVTAGVRALAAHVNNVAVEISQGFDKFPTETELKQNRTIYGGADTGSADAYVVSLTYTPALTDGLNFFFKAANANTGASTLNLNALGAKSILLASGAALVSGDILTDQQVWLAYESNSDTFRIMSQSSSAGGGGGNATTVALLDESSDTTNFVPYAPDATGNQPLRTGSNLTFDAAAGNLGATTFTGNLTGAVTGNVVGDVTGDLTGNADTVTTNANLTGDVTSVGNATTTVTNANLTGDVTSVGNATTTVTNANLTGEVTSVGNAATLDVTAITNQTALASGLASTDELVVSDAGVIKRMDISVLEAYFGYAAQATNHIRSGHTQIIDGDTLLNTQGTNGVITESTWESVGPTGSGADNIWTAMDDMPSEAVIILLEVYLNIEAGNPTTIQLHACTNAIASPTANQQTRIFLRGIDFDVDPTGQNFYSELGILVAVDANQIFKLHWEVTGETTLTDLHLNYKGFMTN